MRYPAVGAYVFAGGFTLGMSRHLEVLAHLEDGPFGVATFQRHFPQVPVHTHPATWPLAELARQQPRVVYANPPCAPWSAAGNKVGGGSAVAWEKDPRVACVLNVARLLPALRPNIWVWESVPLAWERGRSLVDKVIRLGLSQGYSATVLFTELARLGVAQRRRRFQLVLHNLALPWFLPAHPPMTVRDVLGGRRPTGPGFDVRPSPWFALAKAAREGEKLLTVWERLHPRPPVKVKRGGQWVVPGRPGFLHGKVRWDHPLPTQTGGHIHLHPREPRYLTVDEVALLTGFPAEYTFAPTSVSQQYAEVGKGVSPAVGDYLGRVFRAGLEQMRPTSGQVELVDWSRGTLEREPLPVPTCAPLRLTGGPREVLSTARVGAPSRPAQEVPAAPPRGSGAYIRELLGRGLGTAAILAANKRKFPTSKATASDVSWNRARLAREKTHA